MKPQTNRLTGREQRRIQARDARKQPTRPRSNRLHSFNRTGGLFAIDNSTSYNAEQAARLGNEVRLSWYHLCNGNGDAADFENLALALNISMILGELLGTVATDIAQQAQAAAMVIKARFENIGKFGVDAQALEHIPPALDMYDELLRVASPNQLVSALQECLRRLKAGKVLKAEAA